MSLKEDGEAASLASPEEKKTKLVGTFMGISVRRRAVVGGEACYDDRESSGIIGLPESESVPDHHWRSIHPCLPFPGLLSYALVDLRLFPTDSIMFQITLV